MSAFAGIVTFDGGALDRRAEAFLTSAVTALRGGRTMTRRIEGAQFVLRASPNGSGDTLDASGKDGRVLFASVARLDNREELGSALGLAPAELAQVPDGALIRRMIARWQEAGLARCLGAFAFVSWDADARRLTLGRDCLGNRTVFFHRGPDFVAFATTLGTLLALPGVPREIDEIALANFMVVNNCEKHRTFYSGIERVPSRTVVTIDCSGLRHRQYWAPNLDASPPYSREEDYVERARELFDLAVRSATRDLPHLAIATSGGLDSSAIAATAARLAGSESITCFTVVPPADARIDVGPFRYLDERSKVEALGRMHPKLDLRFVTPEHVHALTDNESGFFARTGFPAHGPAVLADGIHLNDAIVDAGHRVALFGSYGNFGLSWSGHLSLVSLLRDGRWSAFLRELRAVARQSNRGLPRVLAADVLMPTAPMPLRRFIYRLRRRDPDSVAHYSALNPAFIADTGLTLQWRAQHFDPWFGPRDWNGARLRAYRMFDHNQYARDLRAMSAESCGYEMRSPHADRRLLEFALSVPEPLYRRNGIPRSFARRVFADRLPREIADERLRGTNAPTWFRFLDARRREIAADIERLDASPLARRLLDVPRLKRLVAQWPKDEHAAERHLQEYRHAFNRGVHIGRFIRWVERGNA
jgi:asparagine synthase (glutamine-hydrolysing)